MIILISFFLVVIIQFREMVKDESKKIERIKKQKRFQVPAIPGVQKT